MSAPTTAAPRQPDGYNPRMADQREHSGQFRVRVPVELHAALATETERQGVSLNTLIVALLAGGMGWRAAHPRPDETSTPPSRALPRETATCSHEAPLGARAEVRRRAPSDVSPAARPVERGGTRPVPLPAACL